MNELDNFNKAVNEVKKINQLIGNLKVKDDISDGSHTFGDLYFHRTVLFAVIINSHKDISYKSKQHVDGSMFPDYFVVGIHTPKGDYSYHYELQYWNYFKCPELSKAPVWDGHQPDDVTRLLSLT